MTDAVLKGIVLGLVVAMMVGPVFFLLLSTSIKNGFASAASVALGVILSDALFISIAYFGTTVLFYLNAYQKTVSLLGGLIIAGYGLFMMFRKATVRISSLEMPAKIENTGYYVLKGFLLNLINPSVFLFWVVIASTIPVKEQYSPVQTFVFYATTLTCILCTDLIKAYSASLLKNLITATFLIWMNRLAGGVLFVYGISIMVREY